MDFFSIDLDKHIILAYKDRFFLLKRHLSTRKEKNSIKKMMIAVVEVK
jgi:hypothetical protein